MDIFTLGAAIFLNTEEYENGLRNAVEQSSNFATKVKTGLSNVQGLFDKFGSVGSTVVSAFQKIGTGVASAFDKIKSIVTNSFTAITGAATGGVAALQGIAESTEGFRVAMGKLNTAYEAAGYSSKTANEAYSEFYKILGDTDTATEASQLLAKLAQSEEDVTQWTNIAAGVSGTFGDSLPIESLIEASNETAKVGAVTGALADALNWAGISEDTFNETLSGLGTEAERNQYIMNTLANTYSDAAASFYKNNEELIKARENQEQLDRVLAKLGETVQSVKNQLFNDFIPAISGVASAFTDLLNGVGGADVALSTAISGMIQTVTEKIPEFLNFGMQILGAIINGIVTNLPQIVTAISQIVQTIATTISNNLPEFLAMGFSVLSQILQGIINDLPQLIQTVSQITQTFSSSITTHLPEFIQYGLQILQQLINGIVQNIPTIIQTAAQIVQQIINGLVQALPQIVPAAVEIINAIINGITQAFPQLATAATEIIIALANGIIQILPTLIPAVVQIIITIAKALTNPRFLVPLINAALQLIVAIVQGITQSLPEIIKAAPEIIGALVVGLVQSLPNLGIAAMKIVYALGTGIRDALGAILEVAADIIGTILQGIGQGIEKIIELGRQIVSGLWKGIKEKAEWIYNKIKEFFEGIVDGIKGILGIHSPSTVFAEIGENMASGLEQGWNAVIPDVIKSIKTGVNAMKNAATKDDIRLIGTPAMEQAVKLSSEKARKHHVKEMLEEYKIQQEQSFVGGISYGEWIRKDLERQERSKIQAEENQASIKRTEQIIRQEAQKKWEAWVGGNPIDWEDDKKWEVWEKYKAQKAEKAANNSETTTVASGVNRTANSTGSTASTQQPLDIYLQLDGMTIARYLLRYNEQAARLTGGSLIGVVNG